jgi:hypothetical protein
VSRGESDVQAGLGRTSGPFEVALQQTGAEWRFELVVLRAREGKPRRLRIVWECARLR